MVAIGAFILVALASIYPAMSKSPEKGIGGLIVHGFEFNRVKQKTIKLVFVASLIRKWQ
jgi:hypothetical protein